MSKRRPSLEAAAMPRKVSRRDAEARDQLFLEAVLAYQVDEFGEAEDKGKRLLERFPQFPPAMLLLGMIATKTAQTERAIDLLQAVIALEPDSIEARTELAAALNASGRSAEAVALCEQAVDLRPDDAGLHNVLGLSLVGEGRLTEAAATFGRAIALKPDIGSFHLNLGIALQAQGHDVEASQAYGRALSLSPDLAEAHARLAKLQFAHGENEAGMASLRRAAAAQPGTTAGRLQHAELQLIEGRVDEAEASIRRVIASQPDSAPAHQMLAVAMQQSGRFDAAIASCERVIALQPGMASAYLGIVANKKLGEADRPLVERMLALLDKGGFGEVERRSLHYALGKAFDDLGDHERAFYHFDEANRMGAARLELAGVSFDREQHRAEIDQLIGGFTREFFAGHAGFGSDSELPILIVGMPRSGTTLVEQIVSSHPEIAASGEQLFWMDRAELMRAGFTTGLDASLARRLADEYCSGLRVATTRRLAGAGRATASPLRITDKMPANFLMLGLIHLVLPRARIIHCRRNPVDTCLSIYFTPFGNLIDFAHDRGNIVEYYEQYARLMAHWRRVLPADRFIDVDYESLVAAPEPEARRIIDFCGLDWDPSCLDYGDNSNLIATPSAWQARQPVYKSSVERWRRYEPWLGEFRRLIA